MSRLSAIAAAAAVFTFAAGSSAQAAVIFSGGESRVGLITDVSAGAVSATRIDQSGANDGFEDFTSSVARILSRQQSSVSAQVTAGGAPTSGDGGHLHLSRAVDLLAQDPNPLGVAVQSRAYAFATYAFAADSAVRLTYSLSYLDELVAAAGVVHTAESLSTVTFSLVAAELPGGEDGGTPPPPYLSRLLTANEVGSIDLAAGAYVIRLDLGGHDSYLDLDTDLHVISASPDAYTGSRHLSRNLTATASFSFSDPNASGAPEPASWALMIGGFGLAGAALRGRRRADA